MASWTGKPGSLAVWAVVAALLVSGGWVAAHQDALLYVPGEQPPDHMQPAGGRLVCRVWYHEWEADGTQWTPAKFEVVLTRPLPWPAWLERVAYRVTLPQARFLASHGAACELAAEMAERKRTGEYLSKPLVNR